MADGSGSVDDGVANSDDALEDLEALEQKKEEDEQEAEELEKTRRAIERTKARGVGRTQLTVNYPREGVESEDVPFVRLPMVEAGQLLDKLETLEGDDGEDVSPKEFAEFLADSLEEYCLDPEKDAAHWSAELTIGDALGLVRNIAFGGAPPGK